MAYSEELAERIRHALADRAVLTERKMFGGIAFMLGGNMAAGVIGDELMVRVDPRDAADAIADPHVRLMEMGGRQMRGFVVVDSAGIEDDAGLARWVDQGADYAASLPPK
jgi:TfoX/Sxy family transcriptional regulator of competence genes